MTSVRSRVVMFAILVAALFGGAACTASSKGGDIATNDYTQFKNEVYPVLARDCAFHACHGDPGRFFRIWGPGRARMDPTSRAFAQPTGEEVSENYLLALSMIDTKNPSKSLLLRKPLAIEAGGTGHSGVDKYGRNVYRSVNDAGYQALGRWVTAASKTTAAPPMVPP